MTIATPKELLNAINANAARSLEPAAPVSPLTHALIAARRELGGTVFKGGTNSHQKYKYVGHEQVIVSGARDALLKHGLILEQRSVEYVSQIEKAQLWRGVHALVHESGEERLYTFAATTQPNDKSAFVASTALDRTAHLRVLELAGSADEDPEADYHDREAREPSRPDQASQRTSDHTSAFLDAAYAELEKAETDAQLVTWFRRADSADVEREAKAIVFKAFAERCKAVGLIPQEVAGRARGGR